MLRVTKTTIKQRSVEKKLLASITDGSVSNPLEEEAFLKTTGHDVGGHRGKN